VITHLSNGSIVARPPPANEDTIMAFIQKHVSVAPIEIQTTFDLTEDGVVTTVDSLLRKHFVAHRPAGNGYFISPRSGSLACDPASGKCGV